MRHLHAFVVAMSCTYTLAVNIDYIYNSRPRHYYVAHVTMEVLELSLLASSALTLSAGE